MKYLIALIVVLYAAPVLALTPVFIGKNPSGGGAPPEVSQVFAYVEDGNTSNYSNANLRCLVYDTKTSAGTGTHVRLTFRANSANAITITDAYYGHQAASGDAYDFDGNQCQLTFNSGQVGIALSANEIAVSDTI
jgi:hypothetical protein